MPNIDKDSAIEKYAQLYADLNTLILDWDPYGLFEAGEMSDEFSEEVTQVLARLPKCRSEMDVSMAIQAVFAKSFSEKEFPLEACLPIGSKVHSWWVMQL